MADLGYIRPQPVNPRSPDYNDPVRNPTKESLDLYKEGDFRSLTKRNMLQSYFGGYGYLRDPATIYRDAVDFENAYNATGFTDEILRDIGFKRTPEGKFIQLDELDTQPRANYIKNQVSDFLG